MASLNGGLAAGFFAAAQSFSDRPALEVDGEVWSYAELQGRAARIAQTLDESAGIARKRGREVPPLTAVFGLRSATMYAGILASLGRGHGYVPMSTSIPAARNREILARTGCRAVIVDASAEAQLDQVLDSLEYPLTVLLPQHADIGEWRDRFPTHHFLGQTDLEDGENFRPKTPEADAIAYVLFTSGSTGQPKGVMVSHANVRHFLGVVSGWYGIGSEDRLTQLFELIFDLSLFDLFAAWDHGACVCCPSVMETLMPGRFLDEARPTIWFSVPSTAWLMAHQRELEPGAYPYLRLSLFCGEALPVDLTESWSRAAPASAIENLYGPTELTISCTRYHWRGAKSAAESENGIVPIGEPFPGMRALVVDEAGAEVDQGDLGELVMAGPQVSLGYLNAPEANAAAFVRLPGRAETYYRTGDLVRRPMPGAPLRYIGRIDQQIKIRGNRVELGEIEAVLRQVSGIAGAVACGWPTTPSGASGVVAFLHANAADLDAIRRALAEKLPAYMVPKEIVLVRDLPLTPSGKADRKRLLRDYERAMSAPDRPHPLKEEIENAAHAR